MTVQTQTANLFELRCGDIRLTYATSSFTGAPQLTYGGSDGKDVFTGDEIETRETALGTEVTVTLEEVPDVRVVTLTFVVPEVRARSGAIKPLETIAIRTTTATVINGKPPVAQTYRVIALHGAARLVDF
jgi:hypothetical protein